VKLATSPPRTVLVLVLVFPVLLTAIVRAQQASPAVPALPADIPSAAERYSFLVMGNLAGQQAVWTSADGRLHIFFQFNDRGRGPKTTSVIKLDATGVPVSQIITGNDYLKSPVSENFSLEAGTARWKNNDEQGERKISSPAYYWALNGGPSEIALLGKAALRNGGKITLLPDGEARVERKTELDVEVAGQKKHVVLYAASGLDFAPRYFWLEGPDKFFASVDEWGSVVPEGWEGSVKTLLAEQNRVKESRSADLAARARPSFPEHHLQAGERIRLGDGKDHSRSGCLHHRQSHQQRSTVVGAGFSGATVSHPGHGHRCHG